MRMSFVLTTMLGAVSLVIAIDSPTSPAHASIAATATPIRHVVVIYQENHTFDEVLGAVCEQRATPCNALDPTGSPTALPFDLKRPVKLADGVSVKNVVSPDVVPAVSHRPTAQRLGIVNKWDRIPGCRRSNGYRCITHYTPDQLPNLSALAETFAVSDATFAAGRSASFGAHVEIGAGTDDGFLGYNPVRSSTGARPHAGWGCPSDRDARWSASASATYSLQPSCVPEADGSGAYRQTPVPSVTSIMQQLETVGLTWKIYNGTVRQAPFAGGVWNFCTYFAWCWDHRQTAKYNPALAAFKSDAVNGTLPSVAFVPAETVTSQHNGSSMARGDNYLRALMTALQSSPEWSSTAVFITYDDCGCFYDHARSGVNPDGTPQGPRVPLVIVSPYARPGYTDTTATTFAGILAFAEHTFGLAALNANDRSAYDFSNAFNFTQAPLPPVHMVTRPLPPSARHIHLTPAMLNDPT